MADNIDPFLKQITEAAKLFKEMTKDARTVAGALNGGKGGSGFSMGSGKNIMGSSFGQMAPSMDERKKAFGDAHDPNKRGIRTASFTRADGSSEKVANNQTAAMRMSGGVFRSVGMGSMRVNADGGLNDRDMRYNQRLGESYRDNSFGRSMTGRAMSAAQGNYRDAFTGGGGAANREMFGNMPSYAQNTIASAMPTPMDSLKLLSGTMTAVNNFMPDMGKSIGRAAGYYNATVAQGSQMNRGGVTAATFDTLNKIGGLSGVGSDANVANYLAGKGMTASSDANSTYQQTIRSVGHAARYLNISNEAATQSIEGLTSGTGSGGMLKNFGIYTSDLTTGKEKTQGQIFEELAQRLTAGRRGASVEQTQASIRRGALGTTINGMFQGDAAGAQMFKQYMVDRAAGRSMDLSNETAMAGLYGSQGGANRNPLNAQMTLNAADTEAMGMAQDEYIKGMEAATGALAGLAKVAGGLATIMGFSKGMSSTIMGSQQVQALTSGAGSAIEYASKGIAGIQEAIIGGEYDTPWGAGISAATVGVIGAGMVAGAMPTAAYLGGSAALGGLSKMFPTGSSGQYAAPSTGDGDSSLSGVAMGLTGGVSDTGSSSGTTTTTTTTTSSGMASGLSGGVTDTTGVASGVYGGYSVTGNFFSKKDNGDQHKATDFAMRIGTPVKAVADGIVQVAVTGQDENTYNKGKGRGLGNYVRIYHQGGYVSVYGHLSKVSVKKGDSVKKGQEIGKSGNSGYSTGGHLHLKIVKVKDYNDLSETNPANAQSISVATLVGANASAPVADSMADLALGTGTTTTTTTTTGGASGTASGTTGSSNAAASSAVSSMFAGIKLNANTQGTLNNLYGLMSSDPATMLGALSSLSAGMGYNLGAAPTYTGAYASALGNAGESTAASLVGKTSGSGNNVVINVQLPSVSESEAEKFAKLVKQFLEEDTLKSNTVRV